MARVTMTRAAVSTRPSAHSPLDNVTTKYNPVRLLKGAPPGQVIQIYQIVLSCQNWPLGFTQKSIIKAQIGHLIANKKPHLGTLSFSADTSAIF